MPKHPGLKMLIG